jgi:hypothetical protein
MPQGLPQEPKNDVVYQITLVQINLLRPAATQGRPLPLCCKRLLTAEKIYHVSKAQAGSYVGTTQTQLESEPLVYISYTTQKHGIISIITHDNFACAVYIHFVSHISTICFLWSITNADRALIVSVHCCAKLSIYSNEFIYF